MASLAAQRYQQLLDKQKNPYAAQLQESQLSGLDRTKIGEADYTNLLGEVKRTGFNAAATKGQTAYLGNQFMVLPAGVGGGKDGWRSAIPVDYDYVGTIRGEDPIMQGGGAGDGNKGAMPGKGYERIVVKKQAAKAPAAAAVAAKPPTAKAGNPAPTKELQQARQDAAEKAQAWRDAPSTNTFITPSYAAAATGGGGSLASSAAGQPATSGPSYASVTGAPMDPRKGNPFTNIAYTGNALYDDPVATIYNNGQQGVSDYKRRFLPMLDSQAMLSAKEIGASSSSAVKNYRGKIPDVMSPDDIAKLYQNYAGQLRAIV